MSLELVVSLHFPRLSIEIATMRQMPSSIVYLLYILGQYGELVERVTKCRLGSFSYIFEVETVQVVYTVYCTVLFSSRFAFCGHGIIVTKFSLT